MDAAAQLANAMRVYSNTYLVNLFLKAYIQTVEYNYLFNSPTFP